MSNATDQRCLPGCNQTLNKELLRKKGFVLPCNQQLRLLPSGVKSSVADKWGEKKKYSVLRTRFAIMNKTFEHQTIIAQTTIYIRLQGIKLPQKIFKITSRFYNDSTPHYARLQSLNHITYNAEKLNFWPPTAASYISPFFLQHHHPILVFGIC
jgi:hypothetical protein